MESLLSVRPFIILVLVLLVILVGYALSGLTGFGRRIVKETETLEYKGDNAKESKPEKQGTEPDTRSIAKETQTRRTLWDWLTLGLISVAITGIGLWYTSSQAVQQRYVQDQQAK